VWTYAALDQRQREIARELCANADELCANADEAADADIRGAILLNEVSPVVTVGRRTPASDLLLDSAALAARGIALERVDRGGLATYHGPGQWVLFPVERLERLTGDRRGVRRAVEGLLEAVLGVCREFEPRAEVRSGLETGVWSPRGKLGAVGIHIEKGILLHGLSLNVFRTPQSFAGIRPCGLEPRVDFLLGDSVTNGTITSDTGADGPWAARDREFLAVGERLVSAVFREFYGNLPKLDLAAPRGYTRDSIHPIT
jgi:lipoate-protein ligase B